MDNRWVDVNDSLPEHTDLRKYKVKILEGSFNVKEIETVKLGKLYPTGFRCMSGDWQRVTHWKPME